MRVELLTGYHCKACTFQPLVAAFCILAELFISGWNKDHTAAEMLQKLKQQMCVWLYFALLPLVIVITTQPTVKYQCEKVMTLMQNICILSKLPTN